MKLSWCDPSCVVWPAFHFARLKRESYKITGDPKKPDGAKPSNLIFGTMSAMTFGASDQKKLHPLLSIQFEAFRSSFHSVLFLRFEALPIPT